MLSFEVYADCENHIYTQLNSSRLDYSTHFQWKLSHSQLFLIPCNKAYMPAFKVSFSILTFHLMYHFIWLYLFIISSAIGT